MSLATRCTHCGTTFKVVQDQLKVSEGWVRCGRCDTVFHAPPSLFDMGDEPVSPPMAKPEPASLPTTLPIELLGTPKADTPLAEWERTLPRGIRSLPQTEPSAPDFELDLGVSLPDEGGALSLRDAPAPMSWEAPIDVDLPISPQASALDERYLMPSHNERRSSFARLDGPEFADAEFPTDAAYDEDETWLDDAPVDVVLDGHEVDLPLEQAEPAFAPDGHTDIALSTLPQGHEPPFDGPAMDAPIAVGAEPQKASLADTPRPKSAVAPTTDATTAPPSAALPAAEPRSDVAGKRKVKGSSALRKTRSTEAAPTPGFLRDAQRQAFWRHPGMRTTLSLALLVLTLGLFLQVAVHFRDLLAAHHPALKPFLQQWCDWSGCRLAPPLRLDDLQVESVTLVRATSDGPDRYRLAVVLHNKAPIDLAWPHVDLTLTNEQGTVIARRAFAPSDAQWLDTAEPKAEQPQQAAAASSTPEAAPHARSTTLMWQLSAPKIQPAGYTAELFYP